MSAQPDFPFESPGEAIDLRMRVGEALCAVVESLAMAGEIRHAHRAIAAVHKLLDDTARMTFFSREGSTAAGDLQPAMDQLRHRARNAETVLKLLE